MNKDRLQFLKKLVGAPGPSGYEAPVARVWCKRVEAVADSLKIDALGSCHAVINPKGSPRVMLSGHIDELGLQVNYIDDRGFIYFNTIGGHDRAMISGRRVTVQTEKGPLPGVTGKRAVHMMTPLERKKVPEVHAIWIDIGAKDGDEARTMVQVGDPITYQVGFEKLHGNFAASRAFDNKLGAFVVAEVLRQLAKQKKKLKASVISVASTQEEIGLRGATTSAYSVNPHVGIAVDVTNATDYPSTKKERHGLVGLGEGPSVTRGANLNPVVTAGLLAAGKATKIPIQLQATPGRTGTDAGAMQLAREGVACGLVGIPLRYMHTPSEVVHLRDVEQTIDLLVAYCLSLDEKADFTPL